MGRTAVIMAGGKGTRITSLNSELPKSMILMDGKPVLQYTIEMLSSQNIKNIILVVGYKRDAIKKWFGTGEKFGVAIQYIEEEVPLGTAGALFFLRGCCQSDFFLLNGDIILDVDFNRFMQFHLTCNAFATIFVHPNNHPYDSSIVAVGEHNKVTNWYDRKNLPRWYQNRVNAGVHILAPAVLETIVDCQERNLDRDVLAPLIEKNRLYAYVSPEYVRDMGTPERFAVVEKDIKTGRVHKRNLMCKQKAFFLDRDGTINRYVGFLKKVDDFELLNGVSQAIRKLNECGYLVIVITNQPVIARGEVTWEQLKEIHNKMETMLGQDGAYVDDIFVCPHHPDKGFRGEIPEYKKVCQCRKPNPGLLLQAGRKYNIDLAESWMVGDSVVDIEAGKNAGCMTGLITNENVQLCEKIERMRIDVCGQSLLEVVNSILDKEG